MGLCTGEEIPYKDIMPQELQNLRKQTAEGFGYELARGSKATPYAGPLTAPQDPLSLMASNIMMGMMGKAGGTNIYGTPQAGTFNYSIPGVSFPYGGKGKTDGDYYTCSQCGKVFTTAEALATHWKTVHKKLEP